MNKFDPRKWLNIEKETKPTSPKTVSVTTSSSTLDDIETITQRIEASQLDITSGYAAWRDLGFALAEELGEAGRDYYQRLSRFNEEYSAKDTDDQYDKCLRAHGTGITIKTFFQIAKDHGVNLSTQVTREKYSKSPISPDYPAENIGETEEIEENSPTFSDQINKEDLPPFLYKITDRALSTSDCDLLLLGSITAISACLPNISGFYAERDVYPNLFLFICAQASAGKGRLSLCRRLVEPIHDSFKELYRLEQQSYAEQKAEWEANKKIGAEPQEPKRKVVIIPANGSSTAVYEHLNDSDDKGLIFETEGDTLANTFKSDYGNFSDGFRKAFHHETISYTRRKDKEFVEIKAPQLSAVLSGTPHQINSLIPNAENGLFSRFIFYTMSTQIVWQNVFATNDSKTSIDQFFFALGQEFKQFYEILKAGRKHRFTFTQNQMAEFQEFFDKTQMAFFENNGHEIIGSVRRMGLITFRIAMILTAIRLMYTSQYESEVLVCDDRDFKTTLAMVKVLLKHTESVFGQLPPSDAGTPPSRNELTSQFLLSLPDEFDRKAYLDAAKSLGIPPKTADKHITRFLNHGNIVRMKHGAYKKK